MLYNLLHSITVLIAFAIGCVFGYPVVFTLCSVWFFIGREIAQAEYRWIEHYGKGKRANMHWYAPLDLRLWDAHSWWWNLALPIIIGLVLLVFKIKVLQGVA
jgi:hypothetical protein